jgi:hypothetical protein
MERAGFEVSLYRAPETRKPLLVGRRTGTSEAEPTVPASMDAD